MRSKVDAVRFHHGLERILGELVDGSQPTSGFVLNPGDQGLLRALDGLSADAASVVPPGGSASVAAHVDHLRYGLSLMNRWSRGENPFTDADYSASWTRVRATDEEWSRLRSELRREIAAWRQVLRTPREVADDELGGLIGSVVHLAYHLGAIRQIDRNARGPRATD